MPEGDTIHRAARTLHAALTGQTITKFETVFPQLTRADMVGRVVESVEAAGKNLLMHFSGDLHIRTHMRMNGSWHLYRPGERWRKRGFEMRIVIETPVWIAVAFNVPVAELHDGRSLERQEDLLRIGPDFLAARFDSEEAKRRIRERPEEEIANVLLNQRVVAGIGNEYKSELLFMAGIHPFTPVRDVSDEQLEELLRISRKVMLANINKRSPGRTTNFSLDPSQRQFVYSRGGQSCRKCAATIQYAKQGKDARGTYWCPSCQPPG
jgi:endonuclease VIII